MKMNSLFGSVLKSKFLPISLVALLAISCSSDIKHQLPYLDVSENKRFLVTGNGDPFFWLGDTGWLLFTKLTREEAEQYLEDRRQKGFNVIQVMILHGLNVVNVYGDTALVGGKVDKPNVSPGFSPDDPMQYDYWDHIDFIVKLAASKGIYMALVPVWGSNVRAGNVTREEAERYASWISERYRKMSNVIWLNGGDVKGSDSTAVWNTMGETIRKNAPEQLITFHPFGRTRSSEWFHNESWLDFNMFQSGHKRYNQDTVGYAFGEDNWKYANIDYMLKPVKPTLDGEPSYEGIPQGLHDTLQPRWTASDVRRYAYWSLFSGCCGFTYGHNSIMQFFRPGDRPAYGAKEYWYSAIKSPGAAQMHYLKELILSKSYFDRVPANNLLSQPQGEKYDYIAVTRGADYVLAYTYNGSNISLLINEPGWSSFKALWFDPRTGNISVTEGRETDKNFSFDPPGDKENGNDWVLILEKT